MIDSRLLRENPTIVLQGISKKKFACDFESILKVEARRREAIQTAETARASQKALTQELASLAKDSPEFQEKVKSLRASSARVKGLEAAAKATEAYWLQLLLSIPNLPHESVPDGRGEDDNVVIATWGSPSEASPHAKPHYDITWLKPLLDIQRGAKVTGAGFPFYCGAIARLVRALVQFFLEEARKEGYVEVHSPLCVNEASATATGQLPDKEGQMYAIMDEGLYLIPTAEVPVTNLFRDEVLDAAELPLRRAAYTPCFRREAGSWGREVRGLNRLHQFDKVERVLWSTEMDSFEQLEALREGVERLLRTLKLPYRTLLMCSGELGFPHAKQYDIEVWAAGQSRWLEVSSCSNFTDFQARRANIRYRDQDGRLRFVHTLNGSALAVPRILAALLENNLQEDGRVATPEVLRPWYGEGVIGG